MSQIIYGIHPVKEALHCLSLQFEKIFISTKNPSPSLKIIIDIAQKNLIPLEFTTKEVLNKLAKGGVHQNVVALIKETSYITLEELLSRWRNEGSRALFLILDSIQDPHNLGSLIRTALGCGAHGIIIPKDRSVGLTPGVIKASSGAAMHLPISRVTNLASTLDILKENGIWIYGATAEAKERVFELDFTIDVGIVIGSESKGIRSLVKKKCDRLFSIPMKGPISSFNASISGGMILYEVTRQRSILRKEAKNDSYPETR